MLLFLLLPSKCNYLHTFWCWQGGERVCEAKVKFYLKVAQAAELANELRAHLKWNLMSLHVFCQAVFAVSKQTVIQALKTLTHSHTSTHTHSQTTILLLLLLFCCTCCCLTSMAPPASRQHTRISTNAVK